MVKRGFATVFTRQICHPYWQCVKQPGLTKKFCTHGLIQTLYFYKNKKVVVPKVHKIEELTVNFCKITMNNIELLWFPAVDHSDLSPIKVIWALMKSNVTKKNATLNISDV